MHAALDAHAHSGSGIGAPKPNQPGQPLGGPQQMMGQMPQQFQQAAGPGLSSHSRLHKYLGNSTSQMSTNVSYMNALESAQAPPFIPSSQFSQMGINDHLPAHSQSGGGNFSSIVPPYGNASKMQQVMHDPMQYQQDMGPQYFYQDGTGSPLMDNGAMMEEMLPEGHTLVQTNGCYVYQCATPPHIGKFRPKGTAGNNMSQFINPDLKLELLNRQLAMECRVDRNAHPEVPNQIDHLNYIVPLENINATHATQSSFKALSVRDGVPYYIRRLHGFRTQNTKQMQPLENWKKLVHVNVAQLREYVTNCRAFGDYSLLLVYDYYPLAETLKVRHFGKGSGFIDALSGAKISQHNPNSMGVGVQEVIIWSYIVQLASAIRCIHASGLAIKGLQASKVLVYGKNKVLISCGGLMDITTSEAMPIQQQQAEDLNAFGRILLALATGNPVAARRDLLQQSMHYMSTHYTQDFQKIVTFLLSPSSSRRTIHEIMPLIGAKFYAQLEAAQIKNDSLEAELSKVQKSFKNCSVSF
ncbi:hypothetical protein WR25_07507 [Diploscapter pachys]|uniref:Protein kinase domain-containing protein n=1 Tax=Diploscapter pachys TaxID=2018661 RepID=A0A2A2JK57_9BILA|nr:hypothetical protein WR25_07507 [Diploscapter pachys]